MATPNTLDKFLKMKLRLPHTFWGPDDGKAFYEEEYETGFQVVILSTIPRKSKGQDKCIRFTADDDKQYVINLEGLKQHWEEKRFEGKIYYINNPFVYFFM